MIRNIRDNFNADPDKVSNLVKFNLELASNTTIAKVIIAIAVKNNGEKRTIGWPWYVNCPRIIPTPNNKMRFGIFNFLEIIEQSKPTKRMIAKVVINNKVGSILDRKWIYSLLTLAFLKC